MILRRYGPGIGIMPRESVESVESSPELSRYVPAAKIAGLSMQALSRCSIAKRSDHYNAYSSM